ncbi:hypothetical protein ACETIH_23435 [Microvirga arabica]|uniref:Transposase n=1 Tax=Microvirga arabica TaxID=1128671 RepID=A0ABV6YED2_9HYPH
MPLQRTARQPKTLTRALKAEICDRIIDGETVSRIACGGHMPSAGTIYRALAADEAFRRQYARAKWLQFDSIADEIIFVADSATLATMEQDARAIEALKRLLVRRMPRKHMI